MDSQKLSQAAEVLVKAAAEHTQETQTTLSKEAVAELKRVAAASEKATTHLAKLESDMGASSKATAARLAKLESDLAELKVSTEATRQLALVQALQWAISNAEIGQFEYKQYKSAHSSDILCSGAFVRGTLLWFNSGYGRWIPDSYYIGELPYATAPTEEHKQAFRNALSEHIHELTGVKPRILKQKNGSVEQYIVHRV